MLKFTSALGVVVGFALVQPMVTLGASHATPADGADLVLATPEGGVIHFLPSEEGGDVLALEESDHGGSALARIGDALGRDATPADAFWALSAPGTAVPNHLKAASAQDRAQGWAREGTSRDALATAVVACDNGSFTGSIAGGFLSEAPFIRLDKKPATYSAFKGTTFLPDWPTLPKPMYSYEAKFNGIQQWRGKVCAKSVAGTAAFPYNLVVSFERYKGELLGWDVMSSGGKDSRWAIPEGSTKVYTWAWNTNAPSNYRILISGAEANDEFDIMMDKPAQ